ncbi:hypothetical protein L6164_005520 [Bauhinia variegata]|uniref:Uncharacterized protein n=1 Tax=Bauhinia variegata TaxID=167791 RepID=A0ACB9PTP0_BAUVA|nr:hypothetical protein L6164_005520 [Bauhinia variegata]
METCRFNCYILFIILISFSSTSARKLEEDLAPTTNSNVASINAPSPIQASPGFTAKAADSSSPNNTLTFFMHDILGGSNPTARAVTGIVNNPAISGSFAFAKPNGAVPPLNNGNGGLINNNNIPFLSGLGGSTSVQNNVGFGNLPGFNGGQLPPGSTFQKLEFGTMTVFDDELTEGPELRSGFLGKAQGFYVASSEDGNGQTIAFTAMFQSENYADTISFFGVHRNAVSQSQLAIMGGTGKYVNAKGFAIVKTFPAADQHETDGVETLLEFNVYVT